MIIDRLEQMEQRYNEMQAQFALPEVLNDHEKYQKIAKALREIETPVEKYRELKQVRQGLAEARAMLAESDADLRAMAEEEIAALEPRAAGPRRRAQGAAAAQGPQRREERDPRNPRRHRRRRGLALCRRNLPHVHALCRAEALEGRSALALRVRRRRLQGSDRHHRRRARLLAAQVGERRAPRAARSGNRDSRAACTPRPSPSPCCPRPKRSTSRSRPRTSASTPSAPPVPAASRSTPPTPPCASRTCPPTPWSVARTRNRRSRTAKKACACCARACTKWRWRSRTPNWRKARKQQVGTGDRSEKIRTYNFPQNRLTDHRIGLTLHQLDLVMEGRLQPIVDALIAHYQAEQLKGETQAA